MCQFMGKQKEDREKYKQRIAHNRWEFRQQAGIPGSSEDDQRYAEDLLRKEGK